MVKPELKIITPFSAFKFNSVDIGIRKDLKRSVIWLNQSPPPHFPSLSPQPQWMPPGWERKESLKPDALWESWSLVPFLSWVEDRGEGSKSRDGLCLTTKSLVSFCLEATEQKPRAAFLRTIVDSSLKTMATRGMKSNKGSAEQPNLLWLLMLCVNLAGPQCPDMWSSIIWTFLWGCFRWN